MGFFKFGDKRERVKKIRAKERKEQLELNREKKKEKMRQEKQKLYDEKMARRCRNLEWKRAFKQQKSKLKKTR